MILVEGPDGAGKSTLVQHLTQEFALQTDDEHKLEKKVRDRVKPFTARLKSYEAFSFALSGEPPLLRDRLGWISDNIYGPVIRNESKLTVAETWRFQKLAATIGFPIIFCEVPWEVAKENLTEETPTLEGWTWEHAREIHERYREHADTLSRRGCNVRRYDYTGTLNLKEDPFRTDTLQEVNQAIQIYLNIRKEFTL